MSDKLLEVRAQTNIKILFLSILTAGGLFVGLGLNHFLFPQPGKTSGDYFNSAVSAPSRTQSLNNLRKHSSVDVFIDREKPDDLDDFSGSVDTSFSASSRISALGAGISNAQRSLSSLKEYLRSAKEKNTLLKEKVDLITSLLDSREKEAERLTQVNSLLRDSLNKVSLSQQRMKEKFDAEKILLDQEIRQKDIEITQITGVKNTLQAGINDMQGKLRNFSDTQASLENQLVRLMAEKSDLEMQLNKTKIEARESLAGLNSDKDSVIQKLNDENSKLKMDAGDSNRASQSMKDTLQSQIDSLTRQIQSKESELSRLNNENKKLIDENGALKANLGDSQQNTEGLKNNLQSQIDSLTQKLQDKETELGRLENLGRSQQEEVSSLTQELLDLRSNLDAASNNHNQIKTKFDAESADLKTQLDDKNQEISRLKESQKALAGQISSLSSKLGNSSEQFNYLESQLSKTLEEKSSLESNIFRMKDDLQKQTEANNSLKQEMSSLNQTLEGKINEIEQMKISRQQIETELSGLKDAKQVQEGKIAELNSRLQELGSMEKGVRVLLEQTSGKGQDSKNDVVDFEKIEGIKETLNKLNSEKETLIASLEEREKSIKETRNALRETESRFNKLQNDYSSYQGRLQEVQQELKRTLSANNLLRQTLRNIQMEIVILRAEKEKRKQ